MQNRVVLITGASAGIGAATVRALAETSRLALVARREDRLRTLADEVRDAGGEALVLAADLGDPTAAATVVKRCVDHYGALDAVVNNAGVFEMGTVGSLQAEHIQSHLQVNVMAPMLLVEAAIPALRKEGGGWIVNVSSVAADATFGGCSVYSASKAALDTWSRIAREDLRADHIRVGVVSPGATDSEIWPEDCPFDRNKMCRSEDIARAIVYMLDSPVTASPDRIVVTPPGGAF